MDTLRQWLLIATEVIFWTGLVAFFAFRHGLKRPDLSRAVLILVVAEQVALSAFGVFDFLRTGTWSLYQTSNLSILVYMLISGARTSDGRRAGWPSACSAGRLGASRGSHC